MRYRFFLQVDSGTKVAANPIYKGDASLEYELENEQQFYRTKLQGKFDFVKYDYDLIMGSAFSAKISFYIEGMSNGSWTELLKTKFYRTDCEIDMDNHIVSVQPTAADRYNTILAGLEKSYDIIKLSPSISGIMLTRRPIIQIVVFGDTTCYNFLGGLSWTQELANVGTALQLVQGSFFTPIHSFYRIVISGNPSFDGTYIGQAYLSSDQLTGTFYRYVNGTQDSSHFIRWGQNVSSTMGTFGTRLDIGIFVNGVSQFAWNGYAETYKTGDSFTLSDIRFFFELAGTAFARYLLDIPKFRSLTTNPITADDAVGENRNYRYAIAYAIDVMQMSTITSTTPTQWGVMPDGTYYEQPYSLTGNQWYPVGTKIWGFGISFWFAFHIADKSFEISGRKPYLLPDAYPLWSVIDTLLSQIDPTLRHLPQESYSQFLYADNNPISYTQSSLFITPKSNVLAGDYTSPAQSAQLTLKSILEMLRQVYQCYWHISGNRFCIEHISYYRNGGSYSTTANIGTDLTIIGNTRNGKKWAFGLNKISYDKDKMPERIEFSWMDKVSSFFAGSPIEMISPYVNEGSVEENNIGDFTSDVDIMLASPQDISQDGFAIFACRSANLLTIVPTYPYDGGVVSAEDAFTDTYPVADIAQGRYVTVRVLASGTGSFEIILYDSEGNITYRSPSTYPASGTANEYTFNVPSNSVSMGYYCTGACQILTYWMHTDNVYAPVITTMTQDTVEYTVQNGYLSLFYTIPTFWRYNLPCRAVRINGEAVSALGIARHKKQEVSYPLGEETPNPLNLVKTGIGNGTIERISLSLSSRQAKTTLKYDTE